MAEKTEKATAAVIQTDENKLEVAGYTEAEKAEIGRENVLEVKYPEDALVADNPPSVGDNIKGYEEEVNKEGKTREEEPER